MEWDECGLRVELQQEGEYPCKDMLRTLATCEVEGTKARLSTKNEWKQ